MLTFRDKQVTPAQIGQQLAAAYVLAGTLRRSGSRLRISAQLIDTHTDFPLWSERHDREMQDIFELQDEIARKSRKLFELHCHHRNRQSSPRSLPKTYRPTICTCAAEAMRGGNHAGSGAGARNVRECSGARSSVRARLRGCGERVCVALLPLWNQDVWIERAKAAASRAAVVLPHLPEADVARAWVCYADQQYDEASPARTQRPGIRKPDCEGGYYLLVLARFFPWAAIHENTSKWPRLRCRWLAEDDNIYTPISNAPGAGGRPICCVTGGCAAYRRSKLICGRCQKTCARV